MSEVSAVFLCEKKENGIKLRVKCVLIIIIIIINPVLALFSSPPTVAASKLHLFLAVKPG